MRAEIELVTVTSLAMGGAAQRGRAGAEPLRARSLRGLLRTWTRFLLAGRVSPDELRAVERRLYGGVHGAGAPYESAVKCVVVPVVPAPATLAPQPWGRGFHGERGDGDRVRGSREAYFRGVTYLGAQAFRATGRDADRKPERWLLPPGQRALVRLRYAPPGGVGDQRDERLLWAALWLLVHLGGAGARSHRAFGSLAVPAGSVPAAVQALHPDLPWQMGESPESCRRRLRQGLGLLGRLADEFGPVRGRHADLGSIDQTRIAVLDQWFGTAFEAQRYLGDSLFAYRHHRSDTDRVLAGNTAEPIERPLWGMPLQMPNRIVLNAVTRSGPGIEQRWPSPLMFRVQQLDDDGYCLVVVACDLQPRQARSGQGAVFRVAMSGQAGFGAVFRLLDDFAAAGRVACEVRKEPWTLLEVTP